jgi:hypothetical protein
MGFEVYFKPAGFRLCDELLLASCQSAFSRSRAPYILGGSLNQLIIPLLCIAAFLLKTRDAFAAAFALWWFGENFMDLAPYIDDARSLTLPLLGGNTGRTSPYGFHDWEFILKESGWAHYDHALAHFAHRLGTVLMILALVWGGYILYKQYKNLKG